jgi:tape measure domain-containing protein
MAVQVAGLNGKIALEGLEQAVKGLNQLTSAFQTAGGGATQAKKPIDDIVAALVKFSIIKEAVGSLISLGQQTIQNYAANERLAASLTALVAKEEIASGRAVNMAQALELAGGKSRELLGWTQKLAIESPFSQEGVAQAFKMAQAYGFVSETASKADVDAKRLTSAMIDFASGSGQSEASMSRIALALGQMQAKGKVAGGEMLQLTEAGLNVRQILADAFGKTTEELVKMQERGLIPADKAIKAIVESLERDFGGAAKRQAGTWAGLLNSLEDIKSVGLREFFTGTFQAVQPLALDFVNTLSDPKVLASIRSWGVELGNFTKSSVTGLQFVIQNIQALTPVIVGAGTAWIGYKVAVNAATFATAAKTASTLILSAAESAQLVILIAKTQGLHAATAATWANIGAQGRMLVTLGVLAIAAAAVTAAYLKWRDVQAQIAQGVQDTAGQTRGWKESADALDAYTKLSPAAQKASRDQADELRNLRTEQEANIRKLAELMIAGRQRGQTGDQYQASLQKERDAINARSTALQNSTGILNAHIQAQDQEIARIAYITGGHAALTSSTDAFAERIRQLTLVTKDSAAASQNDTLAKEAQKAATDLLQARTKLMGDAFIQLNPNITNAGIASAVAAGKISQSVGDYIALTLATAGARAELARLQGQAGVKGGTTAVDRGEREYDTKGELAQAKTAGAQLMRDQADARAAALRNQAMATGTAAERQKIYNQDLQEAIRLHGKNSAEAINAKTALDSFVASQAKTAGTAGSKQANADLALSMAEQDDTLSRLNVKHESLVKHLGTLKQGSNEYKQTLAQILTLEDQIATAKEKQVVAAIDLRLATLDNAKTERSEERRLKQAQRILGSSEFSTEQKLEAADVVARIPLERQKRAIGYANMQRAAGVPPGSTNFAAQNMGASIPTDVSSGAVVTDQGAAGMQGGGGAGAITVQVFLGDEQLMPKLVRVFRNSFQNVANAGGAGG